MKILIAKMIGGVVMIRQGLEYSPALDVEFLNTGQAESDGIVLIDGARKRYITDTQIDTAFLLQKALDVIEQVTAISSSNAYVIGGVTPVFGAMPAFIPITAELEAIKIEIQGHLIT